MISDEKLDDLKALLMGWQVGILVDRSDENSHRHLLSQLRQRLTSDKWKGVRIHR